MINHMENLEIRVSRLERTNRVLTRVITVSVLVLSSSLLVAWSQVQSADEILRTRGLIIEDADGRPRIIMGSPIGDRNAGGNPRTGMIINDSEGVERFAIGLQQSGRVVMGFDAPVGTGDDRNRERITIVADQNGGAYIRFLDRTASVPARIYLDDENRVLLEFIDVQAEEIVRRRIGFSGEEIIREPR